MVERLNGIFRLPETDLVCQMRSRVDRNRLHGAITENQHLLICGPEWSAVDPKNFTGGTKRGDPICEGILKEMGQRAPCNPSRA